MTEHSPTKGAKSAAKTDIRAALEQQRGFREMPAEMLEKLLENMVIVKLKEGTAVMTQGVDHPYTYILLKGKMSIIEGDKHIYDLRRMGDVVGEMALVNHAPSTATVRAHGNCEAIQISKAHLENFGDAAYYLWISRILSEKLSRTTTLVSMLQAKIRA